MKDRVCEMLRSVVEAERWKVNRRNGGERKKRKGHKQGKQQGREGHKKERKGHWKRREQGNGVKENVKTMKKEK